MLDTCGQYFDRGNAKKKLDCFLVYFQVLKKKLIRLFSYLLIYLFFYFYKRYFLFKKETALGDDQAKPFDPMDVEYTFSETISTLRSDFKFVKTYAESVESVAKMENEIRETLSKSCSSFF